MYDRTILDVLDMLLLFDLSPSTTALFPYTTLFRSRSDWRAARRTDRSAWSVVFMTSVLHPTSYYFCKKRGHEQDRKSTRLNSSHLGISYAVFRLKKKTIDEDQWVNRVGLLVHAWAC